MRVAALAMLCACGRFDFDPQHDAARPLDGAVDTISACVFGPWTSPVPLIALSSANVDWGPQVSHDNLELVFSSNRTGSFSIYHSVRAAATDPWPAPQPMPGAYSGVDDPALGTDRLLMLTGGAGLHVATRPTVSGDWIDRGPLMLSTTGFSIDGGPQLSLDRSVLLFTGTNAEDNRWRQYEAKRAPTDDPFAPFDPAQPIPLAHTMDGEAYGAYRDDLLEIVYESEAVPQRLFSATRPDATAAFDAPTPIVFGTQANSFGDPSFSPDAKTLYFASDLAGGLGDQDLWMATRDCL